MSLISVFIVQTRLQLEQLVNKMGEEPKQTNKANNVFGFAFLLKVVFYSSMWEGRVDSHNKWNFYKWPENNNNL